MKCLSRPQRTQAFQWPSLLFPYPPQPSRICWLDFIPSSASQNQFSLHSPPPHLSKNTLVEKSVRSVTSYSKAQLPWVTSWPLLLLLLLSRFSRVRLRATYRRQPTRLPVPGILQARTLEWVAISFSNAWKEKWKWVAQSCLTLSDPMDCNLPGSSIHGIFQARVMEWVAMAFSPSWPPSPWNSPLGWFSCHLLFPDFPPMPLVTPSQSEVQDLVLLGVCSLHDFPFCLKLSM